MTTLVIRALRRLACAHAGAGLVARWRRASAARRARRQLAELDARTLRDIGLTPGEIDSALAELDGRCPATRLLALRAQSAGLAP